MLTSLAVSFAMSLAIIGSCAIRKKKIIYFVHRFSDCFRRFLGNSSALFIAFPALYCILYAYSKSAHLCHLAAANVGTDLFGVNIVNRGLWSVINVKFLPYK